MITIPEQEKQELLRSMEKIFPFIKVVQWEVLKDNPFSDIFWDIFKPRET
mgnify:CR=1 FL=1